MNGDSHIRLNRLGLNRLWLEYGFVDEQFIDDAFENAKRRGRFDEHDRIPFYSKFFIDREFAEFSDSDIDKYLLLVSHESDHAVQSWAIGFIVECKNLTREQLIRLSNHVLVRDSEKHRMFLNRHLESKNASERPCAEEPDSS
jgi:hypothetical protein